MNKFTKIKYEVLDVIYEHFEYEKRIDSDVFTRYTGECKENRIDVIIGPELTEGLLVKVLEVDFSTSIFNGGTIEHFWRYINTPEDLEALKEVLKNL